MVLLQSPFQYLNWLAPSPPREEEVEDPGLGHHVYRAGGQHVPVILLVVWPGVEHGGPEHCREIVQ